MSAKVDLSKFIRGVNLVSQLSKKALPDILNNNILKILIGGKGFDGIVQLTPKATKEQIQLDATRTVVSRGKATPQIILLAAKWAVRDGIKPTKTGVGKRFGKNHGDKLWRAIIKARAKRIMAARLRSRAYIAAGWLKAAQKFGGRVTGGAELFEKGKAARGYGNAASVNRLLAEAVNVADGAHKVSRPLLQRAIDNATKDMTIYTKRKLQEAADRATRRV